MSDLPPLKYALYQLEDGAGLHIEATCFGAGTTFIRQTIHQVLGQRFKPIEDKQSPDIIFLSPDVLMRSLAERAKCSRANLLWELLKYRLLAGYNNSLILLSIEAFSYLGIAKHIEQIFDYVLAPSRADNTHICLNSLHHVIAFNTFPYYQSPKTRFCNFIYRHSAKEGSYRTEFCQQLSKYKKVDCPSGALHNLDLPLPTEKEKLQFMSECKFSISFESVAKPWFISEKIVSAFRAGTVPIYWGAPEIEQVYNPQSFINVRRFSSWQACIEHIKEIDQNPELYEAYRKHNPDGQIERLLSPEFSHAKACKDFLNIAEQTLQRKHRLEKSKRIVTALKLFASAAIKSKFTR